VKTRLMRLCIAEVRLLLRAGLTLAATRLAITLLPFAGTRRLLQVPLPSGQPTLPPEQVAWAVQATARLVPGATCLVRALALERMLRRDGQPARLTIGVAKVPGAPLAAHAWVESDGVVLLAVAGFTRLEPVSAWPRVR
jgi:hypothetical protein